MAGLVKDIDRVVKSSKNGLGVVIHLDSDKEVSVKKLEAFAKANGLGDVALTWNTSGKDSPKGYKINEKVKHTVIAYERKKVKHNFALNKIDDASRKQVVSAVAELMGVDPKKIAEEKAAPKA